MPRLPSFLFRSLLGRLMLLVAAVMVPATLLVSWLIYQNYHETRARLERQLIGAARSTSLLVDAIVTERQALLQGLATSGRLANGEFTAFREQARAAIHNDAEWIVLIDANGQQLANTLVPPGAPLPKVPFRPEFRDAAEHGRSYVSNLLVGPVSHRQLVFTAIPVPQGGPLRYTLNFAMQPSVLNSVLQQDAFGRSWTAAIVDRAGFVAARNRAPEKFVGSKSGEKIARAMAAHQDDVMESTTLDGIASITAFVTSPKTGWRVVIAAPAAELLASAQRMLFVGLGVSGLLGVAATLMALWVGRGVVGAVRCLVRETEAIGRGRPPGEGATGIAETDVVFRALQETSGQLAAREGELQRLNTNLTLAARELREKQERLDVTRTAAATGTFVWNIASGAFECDDGLNALLALSPDRQIHSLEEFLALVQPADRNRVQAQLEHCVRAREDFSSEFSLLRHTGEPCILAGRGRTFPAGDYMAAAFVDVSKRKQHEAEIAQARDTALAAARSKDQFLAALSHELRTPLSPVLLVASEGAERSDYPPAARDAFATIVKNAALEARLIDDLLDLTRITQGKLSLELRSIDVHTVLQEAIATVKAELESKRQTLDLQLAARSHRVQGDATRLQQVFWNILKNAVKFSPEDGHIAVCSRQLGSRLQIEVSDTGIGMTTEEIARSFQSFSQGDHAAANSAHRFGGLGLGLSISRVLVELHHGRILARSAGRGLGTTLVIELPLELRPDPADQPESGTKTVQARPSEGGGLRILVVEDHEATRVAVERLLRRRGHSITSAGTATEAQRAAQSMEFDVVLSDIGLPDFDGYTLMKQLRERYRIRGIALTGYGMEEDIARARAAGFEDHLTKPIDMRRLEEALARLRVAASDS